MTKEAERNIRISILILAFSFLSAGILFWVTYHYDNKYTSQSKRLCPLIDQWEYYPDHLYEPDDFKSGAVSDPEMVYIGQFGNFSQDRNGGSPFGTATYRKCLTLAHEPQGWLLELPEVFSACRIFINGEKVQEIGNVEPAHFQYGVRNTLLSLPDGSVELIIQTSNFSHYYSGMTYPPLLGRSDDILGNLAVRFIFYALLCFFPLGGAAASIAVWAHRQQEPLYLTYGLLCLFFSIHTLYPFIHWSGIGLGEFAYVAEDSSYFAMLSCMVLLTYWLTRRVLPRRLHMVFYLMSVILCIMPAVSIYILFPLFPNAIAWYGTVISLAKLVMCIYLMSSAFYGALKRSSSVWLLSGNAVFGFGILLDFITGGQFEPIRFGWQNEYCGFLMVVLFTGLIIQYNRKIISENQHLTQHLQEEVSLKTASLTSMLNERKKFLSAVAHDLKGPAAVIQTYIDFIRESEVDMDEEMERYLTVIDNKSAQLRDNIQTLQVFNAQDRIPEMPECISCLSFFRLFYEETRSYTDANGIYYDLSLPDQDAVLYCQRNRLFRVFENIILNAVEHTPLGGKLTVGISYFKESVEVTIMDTGEGISPEHMDHIFEYQFSTKNHQGVRGLGLYFVKTSVEEMGGSITAESDPGIYTCFTVTLPLHVQG
ncbi:sensor histidine kinase [Lachnospiraceae bacterium ASD3451]|uniref:sensor histidine kinase n=1 Tax=Diplocloster agilis TaxID=2850323 RepID=UPI001DB6D124|nr:ATP-binding protein [Diplocloster agilis]MBU9745046.1 sensor histidine kinase [Diplocloster agilis]